jgi:hypothetical protein
MGIEVQTTTGLYSPTDKAMYYFIQMLQNNTTSSLLGGRVYPPDVIETAKMPRVTVYPTTPTEKMVGIGQYRATAANRQMWRYFTFVVSCWAKNPRDCKQAADDVQRACWDNKVYPNPPTNNAGNYFNNIEVRGGTGISLNPAKQLYQCTLTVHGEWLELHG